MSLKMWLLAKIRDDKKHAELDEREARTDQRVQDLRQERLRNGFGQIFDEQGFQPNPRPRKERSA